MTEIELNLTDLRQKAEAATPQNFDGAEIKESGDVVECPFCGGEGEVDVAADYCNYDGVALGVKFYGVGKHFVAAEEYYRAANPAVILSLLDRLERAEAENEELRKALYKIACSNEPWERDDMIDVACAALAASPATTETGGWRPIETAPKPGLDCPNRVLVGRVDQHGKWEFTFMSHYQTSGAYGNLLGETYFSGSWHYGVACMSDNTKYSQPTHWLPIPDAPSQGGQQ